MSAAVLIERLPVVMPKPPEWAIRYEQLSFARSQKHRKGYPAEFLAAAAEPPSDDSKRVLGEDEVDIHTTTDLATFFDDSSRRSKADETNDTRTVRRALDKRLYLLVKARSLGKVPDATPESWSKTWEEERWRLPETLYAEEDSLRQCAEGAVSQLLAGKPEDVYFVGNAPFAHVEAGENDADTAAANNCKQFLFWAHWVGQEAVLARGKASDFGWFTKKELLGHLRGTRESSLLEDLLLD